jgi:hypothetical protein
MIDNQAPREKHQQTAKPANEKKLYKKPAFRYERVFETQALACGKTQATLSTCAHNRSAS